jgi:Carboxypeptidase regulatory-like domain
MAHKLLVACVLALAGTAMQASAQSVNGRVTSSTTGLGIPGVKVEIFLNDNKAGEVTTGATGEFQIAKVGDGLYRACIQAQGYISTAGQCPNRTFEVSSDKPAQIEFAMTPLGWISVRVLDTSGNPVPQALVRVSGAARGVLSLMGKSADENGLARIQPPLSDAWLVSATAPTTLPPPESSADEPLMWVRTFYPRVVSRDLAVPISPTPGTETSVEIKLMSAAPRRIRGVVLDPAGEPVSKASLMLAEPDIFGLAKPGRRATQADGSFEFGSLAAREFVLTALTERDGVKLWASQALRIEDRDLDTLKLQLAPPLSVRGKIVTDPPWDGPATKLPIVKVDRVNAGVDFQNMQSGWTGADEEGEFTLEKVYPGVYTISVSNPPPGYYLDSIRFGTVDASGEVAISSGALPIIVTLKQHGGRVRGLVENCVACEIWLTSEDTALRRRGFMRSAHSGANGRYEIGDIRSGEYYVFAIPSAPSFELPVLDQTLINQSVRVSIRGGEATQANLRVSIR